MALASTAKTAHAPRRAPTRWAVSTSGERWTAWRCMGTKPSRMIASRFRTGVPWNNRSGGVDGGSPRSTSTEWPWLARMRDEDRSSAKRCLSLVRTTRSSCAPDSGWPWSARAASSTSTSTQPARSRVIPMRDGWCRSTRDKSLEARRSSTWTVSRPGPPARPAAAAGVIRGVLRAPVVGYWAAMDPIRRQAAIREHLDQLEAELIAPVTDEAAGAEMVAEDGGSDPGSVEPPD
jgi:hypothetical protein